MSLKIFSLCFALLAVVLMIQTVSCEQNDEPDIIFLDNLEASPSLVSPVEALLGPSARNNRICTRALCSSLCGALRYRYWACTTNRYCLCWR